MSKLRNNATHSVTSLHPYIHKRLFGKDYDEDIMKCIQLESERLKKKHIKSNKKPPCIAS